MISGVEESSDGMQMWQENLTMLQIYETTSLEKVGKKSADLHNCKTKAKEHVYEPAH